MMFQRALVAVLLSAIVLASGLHEQQYPYAQLKPAHAKDKLSEIISASRLLSLHRTLVEIESISDNEHDVAEYLVELLERHNYTVTKQEVPHMNSENAAKPRYNLYATPDSAKFAQNPGTGRSSNPKVLLSSHIDTVPPYIPYSLSLSNSSTNTFKREEILISGRGTVDDKACVAAQITAVTRLLHDSSFTGSPSDLALLFVVGEEVSGDGMKYFSDSELYQSTKSEYKAIIFGEPTESKLARGHKGIIGLTLNAQGKAAHSGYPWLGKSANSMILPALLKLDRFGDVPEDEGGLPGSELFGNTTINVGYIQGGVASNVVPEHATAKVSFRLAGGTDEQNRKLITDAINSADPEGLLNVTFTQGYGPVYLDDDVPGFDTVTVNYGTDVPNIKVDEGVKRYLFGPGSIFVAHGANEGLTVGELESAVSNYEKLIRHALSL